ncbi:MAG TPA: copper homeostasis protein CutC [Acidobacteriaceae bacterium]|jgi:copper homeostasis protein|nr:copper homeostasis protein CutC [Acidobacteriaceae bacterium]
MRRRNAPDRETIVDEDSGTMQLEICVDSAESARAAERGGAQRVELCSDLMEGGITPSHGLIAQVRRRIAIDLFVIVRPRGGDFCYSGQELEQMADDIAHARDLGANGITLGVLDEQGCVDVDRTRRLVQKAGPLAVTFHRAIDMTPDPYAALGSVIESGATRVLTSGGAAKASQGMVVITRMQALAENRIRIMAGGGITAQTVARIAETTGATEFHASLRTHSPSPVHYRRPDMLLGEIHDREYLRYGVREEAVRALVAVLQQIDRQRASASAGQVIRP